MLKTTSQNPFYVALSEFYFMVIFWQDKATYLAHGHVGIVQADATEMIDLKG